MNENRGIYDILKDSRFQGQIVETKNIVNKEELKMNKDNLIYEKDLKNLEEKIDLKLENTETRLICEISNMKTEINSNFGVLKSDLENMINKKSAQEEKERKKENRETIRTILMSVTAIVAFAGLLLKFL
ncbi:hypothetical protein [Carnobacterium maltaromaticum]|uniref:hypothetical protein n=1 Tax=Carnobacterium maltaromaticum TaxID=2751 RepID=UPI00295EFF65|nr:hypothetical protein [Carnobacterium maltaromaticum]